MELNESLNELSESKEFLSWKKDNAESYLSHAFMMKEPNKKGTWEFGFCAAKDNSVTVFEVRDAVIRREPESAFKKEKAKIIPLEEKKITSRLDDVLAIVDGIVKEKYAGQLPMKIMVVVQTLPSPVGQCWNISYVLHSFKILNVKISTDSKKVLDEKIVSLIQNM